MRLRHAWLIAAALTTPGQLTAGEANSDVEVVKFTAGWCEPCRAMEPTLQRLGREGYRIIRIDVDQRTKLAQRYQVTSVPTLLLVSGGQVVDRIDGAVGYQELVGRLQRISHNTRPLDSGRDSPTQIARAQPTERRSGGTVRAAADTEDLAYQASVRLRVEDEYGNSYGSGTIVHVHGSDALILTCGHIFRESRGNGKIMVDLYAPGADQPVEGQLVRYDLKRDLALVGIRTSVPLRPILVAGRDFQVTRSQRLFSVGCNQGKPPTVMRGHLKAVNKYLGPQNLVVAGRPEDGRSGGGLFSYDGYLVGVCNAADQEIDEGLYAAFASIQGHLDEARLSFVYQRSTQQAEVALASTVEPINRQPPATLLREPARLADSIGNSSGERTNPLRTPQPKPIRRSSPLRSHPFLSSSDLPNDSDGPDRLAQSRRGEKKPSGPAQRGQFAEKGGQANSPPRSVGQTNAIRDGGQAASGASLNKISEDAEVIVIIRPKSQSQGKSEVMVLDRPSREIISQLNREHQQQRNRQTTQLRVLDDRR